ncbi:MAG: hypothetical protein JWM46_305 [Candidatus Kaiserbacteria bacterium]|nr:hypothetical protein [Candidatus Kaiserbacteria bacterium]
MLTPKTTSVLVVLFTLCAPALVSADVIINEFLYDAPGTDTDQEYVELLNTGSTAVDLTKWKINDGSAHTFNVPPKNGGAGSITIAPGGYALLVDNATNFLASHSAVTGTVIDTVLSLSNLSGTISLTNDTGAVVSTVSYTKDQGGNGDGNSLQNNAGTWIMALPTPNAANATVAAVPVVADSSTSTSTTTTQTSTTNTTVSSYVPPPVPTVFADAGGDRTVIVGADAEFDGRAYDRNDQDLDRVRFMWNFGDGSTAEGATVMHHYDYPGRYAVVLSIAQNKTAVEDVLTVDAEPAKLTYTTNADGSISIGNSAGHNLDLSRWVVRSFARNFILPEHSILLKGATLRIAQPTLGFYSGPDTELDYPNGVLALKANESTPAEPVATAQAPIATAAMPATAIATTSAAEEQVQDTASAETAVSEQKAETDSATTSSEQAPSSQLAAAAGSTSGHWYWYVGVVGLVGILGAAAMMTRRMKASEWDIVEESPEAE